MQKIYKELEKFKDFVFFEQDHHYEYKGIRVSMSVTKLIEEYSQPFDQQGIAEKCAIRDNKSVNEVLEEWRYKNKWACEKGTTCHEYAQSRFTKKEYQELTFDGSADFISSVEKIKKQADQFYQDFKDKYKSIKSEQIIGDIRFNIASAVDHLFWDKSNNELILADYKTNSILKGYNDDPKNRRYTKNMKVPLQDIPDDSLNHYYLQLSIYKYILESNTNLKVGKMIIVYMSENIEHYEIIEVSYLKEQAIKILENRRERNMKSVSVLLIGESGTGKTTSFRNMPAGETAIINVTNKPLPYKDKGQAVVSSTNYNAIIDAIKETKKRAIIIDDSTYLMAFENFEKATDKGYTKFTEMAQNYYKLIKASRELEDEKITYTVTHEDIDDMGYVRPKTIGKMLNSQLNVEGLFTIVLRYIYKDGKYLIQTHKGENDCVKTPMDMFDKEFIENDLYEIDKIIRKYYDFKPLEESEEK